MQGILGDYFIVKSETRGSCQIADICTMYAASQLPLYMCRFGGPHFSYLRMSWVKTNFLWMMYRSGWATKHGQERVLAVRITKEGFDNILSKALTGHDEKTMGLKHKSAVRLQWDPDHTPSGAPERRRAIQLGLRDEVSEVGLMTTVEPLY